MIPALLMSVCAMALDLPGWLISLKDTLISAVSNISHSLVQWPPVNIGLLVIVVIAAWAFLKVAKVGWGVFKWGLAFIAAAFLIYFISGYGIF